MELLKIQKTCFSKTATTHYLGAKETVTTIYSDSVMSKIDCRDYDLDKVENLDKYKFL
jgi:hypothetical protein